MEDIAEIPDTGRVKRPRLQERNDSADTSNLFKRKWLKVASSPPADKELKSTIRVLQFNTLADGEYTSNHLLQVKINLIEKKMPLEIYVLGS